MKPVLHAANAVSNECKPWAIENGLLNTSYESKTNVLANFTDFSQEAQVKYELLVFPGAQIIEQLIHDKEQAMVRKLFVERSHHFFKGRLVSGHLTR